MSLRRRFLLVAHAALAVVAGAVCALHVAGVDTSTIFFGALGIVVVAGFLLVVAWRRLVTEPVARFRRIMDRIASGSRIHRIRIDRSGELAALSRSFNAMTGRLRSSQETLARQVVDRTRELHTTLEALQEGTRRKEEVGIRPEESERIKTDFLTTVSHELRTPLNSILGFMQLVLDDLVENDEERREFLENARQSARHMLNIVNDVMTVARIEEGQESWHHEALELAPIVEHVLRALEPQAREKGLELRRLIPADIRVLGDRGKLRQVLFNLVGNAVKFTDAGFVCVHAERQNGQVAVCVEDTGSGIPAEELDLVFEKFHQVDGSRTRRHGGAGLGLSIARELVHLMGGQIAAHSEGPGRGTRVVCALPAVREKTAASS